MIRLVLCAGVALAACSSEPGANVVAPSPSPAPSPSATATATPEAAADARARPEPGVLKTFGDWTVGCDNTRRCELRSLGPDLEPPSDVTVAIARDPGPDGRTDLALADRSDEGRRMEAAVDGRVAGDAVRTVIAMANGQALQARSGGRTIATISLKGASAALRYVDAVQGRAGTVTAWVAKGNAPATAVPAAPLPPRIVAVAPGDTPATASPAQLGAMRRAAGCDAQLTADDALGAPEAHALGGGRTLVLLPCSTGAYNLSSAVFVLDRDGFAAVKSDAPLGFSETGAAEDERVPTVVNGSWDAGVLTSYAKARGLGDCGVIQELVWDGARLRLSRQREMGECRGNTDYITTWRAGVVRR